MIQSLHLVCLIMSVSPSNAGTAEPMGVSPPKAVAYQILVDENRAFRQCINPDAKRFEVKYKKSSPAMLEGFTDHCLTLEGLLMLRGAEMMTP